MDVRRLGLSDDGPAAANVLDRTPTQVTDNGRVVAFATPVKIPIQVVQPALFARGEINRDTRIAAPAAERVQITSVFHVRSRAVLNQRQTLAES
jgi:hypothetical protein